MAVAGSWGLTELGNIQTFWISRLREIIVEVAVARGDEEEEPDEEVGPEDTENGSKGTKNDDEDHVIDNYLHLVWTLDILQIL